MPHVTFIHGICNKPAEEELLKIWRSALAHDGGLNLSAKGVTSSMVYWADVMYAEPSSPEDVHESTGDELAPAESDDSDDWRVDLNEEESEFVKAFSARLGMDEPSPEGDEFQPPVTDDYKTFEAIPLPWFIKRRVMKALLKDVHHYLFNTKFSPRPGDEYFVQDEIRKRFVETLERDSAAANGRHVVVSHSMGTVIAYDCLKRVPECPAVDGLMTIGSPLGLEEVQTPMKPDYSSKKGYPEKVKRSWRNIFDRLDPVAGFDARIANDYKRDGDEVVEDTKEQNWGRWRHDITKYMAGEKLRKHLAKLLKV